MIGYRRIDLRGINIVDVVHWLNLNKVSVLWDPPHSVSIYYATGLIFTDDEALLVFKLRFDV